MPLDSGDLGFLTRIDRSSRVVLGGILEAYLKTDQLQDYRAYPKQAAFHLAGQRYTHRLLRAGNQVGKSLSCGAEVAMHLTGEYPRWWRGKRFDFPIIAWCASETADATRDNPQRVLLGLPNELGTGMIPKRCITPMLGKGKGVADAYDYLRIRHRSGGLSMLRFRNYAQKRNAWQGPPVNLVWYDEEPPADIYGEGIARTMAVGGISIMSFTPLMGHTEVVQKYDDAKDDAMADLHTTEMTIYDAQHYTAAEIEQKIANTAEHERDARILGKPMLGSGRIFTEPESEIVVDPFVIPEEWVVLGGLDIGASDHPTAAIKMAWDRDNDVVYITKDYRRKNLVPSDVWLTLRRWGHMLKWAWPKDALQHEAGTGRAVIELYKDEGMRALPDHAAFAASRRKTRGGGGNRGALVSSTVSPERGVLEMQTRMKEGGWKVFSNCEYWLEEYRMYHRKDGKIVKKNDDCLDASRYAMMMLRYATVAKKPKPRRREESDWQAGV